MKKLTIGILAHVDAGKTTLSEGLLYAAGALRTLGRVDHGNAFLDTEALERERGITIFAKQAVLDCGGTHITLLDTPGHVDFSAEAERTLQVLMKVMEGEGMYLRISEVFARPDFAQATGKRLKVSHE